ncbi:MAG TPA: TOBE domain-containing protein, partial [Aquihabitans sp.]|nr:TOBE domain-containing protein [Aquihabitans sp.]
PAAEVWARPGSAFVARFLGHDNVLDAGPAAALGLLAPGVTGGVVVREAAIRFTPGPAPTPGTAGDRSHQPATVVDVRFRGATSHVVLAVGEPGGGVTELRVHTSDPPAVGATGSVAIDPSHVVALDDAGVALLRPAPEVA